MKRQMFGSYMAEEIYINAQFAGHRGVVGMVDQKLYFINPERIAEQWTPLAEQYQMAAVDKYHPLDNNNYGKYMMANQYEYKLVLKNLMRVATSHMTPDSDFHIASLEWTVRLVMHENSPLDYFRVTFEISFGWTAHEEIGQVVYNPAALNRLNFTP